MKVWLLFCSMLLLASVLGCKPKRRPRGGPRRRPAEGQARARLGAGARVRRLFRGARGRRVREGEPRGGDPERRRGRARRADDRDGASGFRHRRGRGARERAGEGRAARADLRDVPEDAASDHDARFARCEGARRHVFLGHARARDGVDARALPQEKVRLRRRSASCPTTAASRGSSRTRRLAAVLRDERAARGAQAGLGIRRSSWSRTRGTIRTRPSSRRGSSSGRNRRTSCARSSGRHARGGRATWPIQSRRTP